MASWNWPQLANKILTDVPFIAKALVSLLKMDPTGIEDVPTGAIRLYEVSSGNWQFQKYNGTSWNNIGKLQMDCDTVDSYQATVTANANTIAVRNASGLLEDSITGNAATATSAVTLSEILPIALGGTGAGTSEAARSNLGVPPTSHASSNTTYGLSSDSQYGHAKSGTNTPQPDADEGASGDDISVFARQDHVHPKVLATSTVKGSVLLSDATDGTRGSNEHVAASEKAVADAYKAATTVMTGATDSTQGKSGLVPQPAVGDQDKVLKGDGTWAYLSGMPIGTIFWSASATPVDGAIICNGATPLIATYPDLYAVIGTRYGGDGVTTFGVPNMIGRVAWGATTPGTYLEAGLPNITGYDPIAWGLEHDGIVNNAGGQTGALAAAKQVRSGVHGGMKTGGTTATERGVAIDASLSSPIYGNSDTVQPPALTLVPYIKAYDTVQNVGSMDAAQLASEINRLDGKFGDYLPTSGGTMEGGSIKLNANTRIGTIFYYDSAGYREVGIEANTENEDGNGAVLTLRPSDSSSIAGSFALGARTNRNDAKWLGGDVSGTLTWNGKNIVRSVNGNNADNAGNVHLPVFIANQSNQIYLPEGGTWNVLYMNWGTDWGVPYVTTLAGGAAVPMGHSRTVVFAIRMS